MTEQKNVHCPATEMESFYRWAMGIEHEDAEIVRQKVIATESGTEWLVFLREVSEEILLLEQTGCIRVNRRIKDGVKV
jgi:hypothetical protein